MARNTTRGHIIEDQVVGEEDMIGAAKTRMHKRSPEPKHKRPASAARKAGRMRNTPSRKG
jgi:hypothetical protein